jgi:hypothetical protein
MGTKLTAEQTQAKEQKLRDLERQIEAGVVTVKRNGEDIEFVGWNTDRTGPGHWHDDCAYRTLMAEGSTALRMALARQQPDRMARRVVS